MYTIGIDLGGTNIVASVVNDEYKIIATSKTPTNSPRSADEIFDDIAEVCEEAVKSAGLTMDDIESVGMGTPGTVNADGIIEFANNLAFNNVPARTMLAKRLNKPEEKVFIENDANCAALGEAKAGVGNGAKDFVAVTLGTGVGSGVIIDGKIVNGVNYAGGECGHMVIVVDGEQCSCGRKGCWEAYASATALIRQTKKAMEEYPDSLMHKLAKEEGKVSGRTAFDAMRLGDIAGIKVVDDYIKYVACGLINLVNALQPEIICIGGGICNEGETLMKPLRRFVQAERYSIHSKIQTKIVKAELGNDAGVIGAALLGIVK
ncbi:MAG: ROK family protein [Eubacteriales bacterium]|nr:ROK family protein [Eubacteriales bacterium]